MKRTFIIFIVLLLVLCGCANNEKSSNLEESKSESTEYKDLENQNDTKEIAEGSTRDFTESAENNTEYTKEEYIDKAKVIFDEIKEEAAIIGIEKTEILFNGVFWGSSLVTTNDIIKEKDGFYEMAGLVSIPISANFMLGIGIEFDERFSVFSDAKNVSGIGYPPGREMKVAGYDVESCMLLFSAIEKDGEYILTNDDSALYAAQYTIKPVDCGAAMEDLKTKISSIYGDPDSTRDIEPYENAPMAQEYIYWYGANDTVLVLTADSGGMITISYVWLGGEELLNAALDNAEKYQSEKEGEVYGDGDTSGL